MADIIIVPMEQCHVTQVAGLEAQCFSMPWSEKAFADAVESPNLTGRTTVSSGMRECRSCLMKLRLPI